MGRTSSSNALRNARRERGRRRRWAPARDAAWALVEPFVAEGARVAVVGAGNGDSVPLRRLAKRAGSLTLVDLDAAAMRRAKLRARVRAETVVHDVTGGEVDRLLAREPSGPRMPTSRQVSPLPGAPYDLVIGDLLYSQLIYPALLDSGRTDAEIRAAVRAHQVALTRAVVEAFHASAPTVLHVHDPLAWWDGHEQPVTLEHCLAHPAAIKRGVGPKEADPRAALRALGIPILATAVWHWPFKPGVDYLAMGTVAGR